MKLRLLLILLMVGTFVFMSCEPEDVNTNFKNYWSANALVRLKLKGKVKFIESEYERDEFNEKGFLVKSTSLNSDYSTIYTYGSGGELTKTDTNGDITSYTYDKHGKYIVNFPFHLHETGLTPNLKSIVSENNRTDYVFNGDNLLIIESYKSAQMDSKDTTIVKYNGKYPVSSSTEWSFMNDMEFAKNGMFLKYSEGFVGEGYSDTRTYSFLKDDEYQMVKNVVMTNVSSSGTSINTITMTYNDKKDIVKELDGEFETEYFDYVYDEKNNWTKRTSRYRQGSKAEWQNTRTETRTITYW